MRVGLACDDIPMPLLSLILENNTHEYVPSCGVRSAMIAAVSAPLSGGATNYTSCSVQLSRLGYTFLVQ